MKRPDPLDVMIGERIRELRLERGLSQNELGTRIGTSVHDVEVFETGDRRVGAARLMHIAKALRVDVGVLFGRSDAPEETAGSPDCLRLAAIGARHSPSRSIH